MSRRFGEFGQLAGRIFQFAAFPLLGLLVPFVALPVLARVGSVEQWVGLGIGQAIGAFGRATVMWGWWAIGPTYFASVRSASGRALLYRESMHQRAVLLLFVAVLGGVIAAILTPPGGRLMALLSAVALSASGLLPSWYFLSIGKPLGIAVYEALPNAIAVGLGVMLVWVTREVIAFPLVQLVLIILAAILFDLSVRRHLSSKRPQSWSHSLRRMRVQAPVALTNLIGISYSAMPLPVAGAVASSSLTALTSADRIYRVAAMAPSVLINALQAWVLEREESFRRRQIVGVAMHAVLGVSGAAALVLLGPWFSGVLFGPSLAAGRGLMTAFGVAFAAMSVGIAINRLILLPAGRARFILAAGVVGAVVGIMFMIIAGLVLGAVGVAWGLAVSEIVVVSITAVSAIRHLGIYPEAEGRPEASDGGLV